MRAVLSYRFSHLRILPLGVMTWYTMLLFVVVVAGCGGGGEWRGRVQSFLIGGKSAMKAVLQRVEFLRSRGAC